MLAFLGRLLGLGQPEPPTLPVVVRSHKWPAVRKQHLAEFPACAVCHSKEGCVPHHVWPVHVLPSMELEPTNLVTLCPGHHLTFGHLGDWRSWNLTVRTDALVWSMRYASRPRAQTGVPTV